jgi:hypothetical protein
MDRHDGWFLLVMGACFVVCARPYGRALGEGLEGPSTPEERAIEVRRHVVIARIFGAGLIGWALWLLLLST